MECRCSNWETESIFPGSWKMSAERCDGHTVVKAEYTMNLVARMAKGDNVIKNQIFCLACNHVFQDP